ncbi:hypothetical protein Ciccas_003379 [Cichlidogyrus casuarinus]|uniref:Uncharacterized protein n=1 Tax=Cichlidogyrus casuarinus TaxID=1844966 RepID=A0ABD2QHU0_9PLAT
MLFSPRELSCISTQTKPNSVETDSDCENAIVQVDPSSSPTSTCSSPTLLSQSVYSDSLFMYQANDSGTDLASPESGVDIVTRKETASCAVQTEPPEKPLRLKKPASNHSAELRMKKTQAIQKESSISYLPVICRESTKKFSRSVNDLRSGSAKILPSSQK